MRFQASGEILTTLDQDVFDGKTAREVKQTLAANVRVSRFRQRLFTEDGFHEIHDDEAFGSAPVQVQLVILEFLPPDAEEDELMISACHRNNTVRLEKILQGHRNPNLSGAHGSKVFRLPKLLRERNEHPLLRSCFSVAWPVCFALKMTRGMNDTHLPGEHAELQP